MTATTGVAADAALDAHLVVPLDGFDLDVALHARPGRVLAVLGPNGAGKTTSLRALQGTVAIAEGRIELAGRVLDDPSGPTFVRAEDRNVAMVHQDLLLFPHLSALDNVAFGRRARGTSRSDARRLALEALDALGVGSHADRRPHQLSGGQAQRVALARALATDPDLLLLDEPLAALDAEVRGTTRRELHRALASFAGVAIVVTHDPVDALTLAQDVVVLEGGRVAQSGTIAEVTARPRTRHVAELLGMNLITGDAEGSSIRTGEATVHLAEPASGPVFATIAPSAVTIGRAEPDGSARNRWPLVVVGMEPLGERVRVRLDGVLPLVAEITTASLADLGLEVGASAWASVKATEVRCYPR